MSWLIMSTPHLRAVIDVSVEDWQNYYLQGKNIKVFWFKKNLTKTFHFTVIEPSDKLVCKVIYRDSLGTYTQNSTTSVELF